MGFNSGFKGLITRSLEPNSLLKTTTSETFVEISPENLDKLPP